MKVEAKVLYPEFRRGTDYFLSPSCYQPMLNSFGNIILQVDDNGWQGDSRLLYRDGDRIGYLQFGWGSCTGCDSLQACGSYRDIDELIEELEASIMWFDSAEAALEYFNIHDWQGDYSWHAKEQKVFIEQAKALLESS